MNTATVRRQGVVRTPTMFRPQILSRHPSHNCLRRQTKNLPLFRFRSVVRLGSTTEATITRYAVEVNSVRAIQNSSNKLLMKRCFDQAEVKTPKWRIGTRDMRIINEEIGFPLVAKAHFGSKGRGNTLIHNEEEFNTWQQGKNISHYLFEKFMNYGHEFRLHISSTGCFYTCRKAMKQDTPQEERWHFHDDTCVWLLETNENFQKPSSWNDIERDCVSALNAIGADVLSFDVKVQTPVSNGIRRNYQEYILIECNSASSMDNGSGELSQCAKAYIEEIPKIINRKANIR